MFPEQEPYIVKKKRKRCNSTKYKTIIFEAAKARVHIIFMCSKVNEKCQNLKNKIDFGTATEISMLKIFLTTNPG